MFERQKRLTLTERVFTEEEEEGLNQLMEWCRLKDISFDFSFDTGRHTSGDSDEVIQGPQGYRLEIGGCYLGELVDDGNEMSTEPKLYRDINDLIDDGWLILKMIATSRHIDDIELALSVSN